MAAVDPAMVKAMKIKTGVVKRLAKEKIMYGKEVIKEEERKEKMKAEGKDDYVIRKQGEVVEESKMMIPDCKRRIVKAVGELKQIVDQGADLKDTAEYKAAQEVLAEVEAEVEQENQQ